MLFCCFVCCLFVCCLFNNTTQWRTTSATAVSKNNRPMDCYVTLERERAFNEYATAEVCFVCVFICYGVCVVCRCCRLSDCLFQAQARGLPIFDAFAMTSPFRLELNKHEIQFIGIRLVILRILNGLPFSTFLSPQILLLVMKCLIIVLASDFVSNLSVSCPCVVKKFIPKSIEIPSPRIVQNLSKSPFGLERVRKELSQKNSESSEGHKIIRKLSL